MEFLKNSAGIEKPESQKEIEQKPQVFRVEFEKIKNKIDRFQTENAAWEKEFNKLESIRREAILLEKEDHLNMAISTYLEAIKFAEQESKLALRYYLHDINRIIILYAKTGQLDALRKFLKKKISIHSHSTNIKEWKTKLSKLEMKE